jgi:hypothetical protein
LLYGESLGDGVLANLCVSLLEVDNQFHYYWSHLFAPLVYHIPPNLTEKRGGISIHAQEFRFLSALWTSSQVGKIGYLDDEPRVEGDAR